jgi:integrase
VEPGRRRPGEDVRFVQAQLGHASIAQTVDTYSHLIPDAHEHHVAALDRIVRG